MTVIHPAEEGGDAIVRHVDGNAIVGSLADLFAIDPSVLVLTCGHCGAAGPLAETVVEDDARCAIVRCRRCARTLLTLLREDTGASIRIAALAGLDAPRPATSPASQEGAP
jgi:hypothetical protein